MATLRALFSHLVLPPQLPGEQDGNIESISYAILDRLIQATTTLGSLVDEEERPTREAINSIGQSLRRCQALHQNGHLDKQLLISEFRNLKSGQTLLLHTLEQNAAILIRQIVR